MMNTNLGFDENSIVKIGALMSGLKSSGFDDRLKKMSIQAQLEFYRGLVFGVNKTAEEVTKE